MHVSLGGFNAEILKDLVVIIYHISYDNGLVCGSGFVQQLITLLLIVVG